VEELPPNVLPDSFRRFWVSGVAPLDHRLAVFVVLLRIRIDPTQPRAAHAPVGAVIHAMLACEDDG